TRVLVFPYSSLFRSNSPSIVESAVVLAVPFFPYRNHVRYSTLSSISVIKLEISNSAELVALADCPVDVVSSSTYTSSPSSPDQSSASSPSMSSASSSSMSSSSMTTSDISICLFVATFFVLLYHFVLLVNQARRVHASQLGEAQLKVIAVPRAPLTHHVPGEQVVRPVSQLFRGIL